MQSAMYSASAGPCLNPWPEPPPKSHHEGRSGWRPKRKCESDDRSYWQTRVPITFQYAEESDAGPYPIPADAPIEGGPKGTGDRHVIVLDRDEWRLYEVFNAFPDGRGGWRSWAR